jgi:hypothetical protein
MTYRPYLTRSLMAAAALSMSWHVSVEASEWPHEGVPVAAPEVTSIAASSQSAVKIAGKGEPGAPIKVYGNKTCLGDPIAQGEIDADGQYSIEIATKQAEHPLSVKISDGIYADSPCAPTAATAPQSKLTASVIRPAMPKVTMVPLISNSNYSEMWVEGAPGARVYVYEGGNCQGRLIRGATLDPQGDRVIPLPTVADNTITTYSLMMRVPNSRRTVCSSPHVYVEDSVGPRTVPSLVNASTDRIGLYFLGTKNGLPAGTFLQIYASTDPNRGCVTPVGLTFLDNLPTFTIRVDQNIPDGEYYFTLRAYDQANNPSQCSAPFHVSIY